MSDCGHNSKTVHQIYVIFLHKVESNYDLVLVKDVVDLKLGHESRIVFCKFWGRGQYPIAYFKFYSSYQGYNYILDGPTHYFHTVDPGVDFTKGLSPVSDSNLRILSQIIGIFYLSPWALP